MDDAKMKEAFHYSESGDSHEGAKFASPNRTSSKAGPNIGTTADNHDERYESFILGPGESKVEVEHETRVPNAAMFTFNKEDHTLGNLISSQLHKTPHVLFAGYQVPHPLNAMFKLRVQTDGEITPKDAVKQVCRDLVKELEQISQEFTKEMELKKIADAGARP